MTSRKLGSLFLIGMLTAGIFTIPHTTLCPTFRSQSTSAWTYSRQKIYPAYSKTAFSQPASQYSEASQCQTLPRQRIKWSCHFMNDFSHPFCSSSLSHYTNQSSSLSRLHPRTHASVTSIYFTHRRSPKLYAQAMIPSAFCIITGYSYLRLLYLLDIPRQPSPCSTRRIYGQVLPLSSEIAIATGHLSLGHTVVFTSSFIFTGL